MQGPDDEVESDDPNEVVAKAYMAKNKPVEEDSPRQTQGPLNKKDLARMDLLQFR